MIKQNLTISLISLRSNLLRSFLTTSGIVIGIAAVVAVLSIGKGNEEKIEAQIQQMGANLFWVTPMSTPLIGNSHFAGQSGMSFSSSQYLLTRKDANAIRDRCKEVLWSAPVITSFGTGELNGKTVQLNVIATDPEYLKVKSLEIVAGRYLVDEDLFQLNNVCVIEETPGLRLYPGQENFIFLNSRKFKIVGIIKREKFQIANINSIIIYIPLTVAQKEIIGSPAVQSIYCIGKDNALDIAKRQVETILSSRNGGKMKYDIRSTRDLLNRAETLTRTATMVTAGIGMISLFVGGIGIMNILLASVFERIKEIGIRRSVGARKRDILLQFLFEAIAFSLFGGVIGVIGGLLVTKSLSLIIDIPAVYSFEAVLVGLVFSCFIGLIFGVYPAWKAANFNPIESLRYE
ncbi:MAG: ABC transporter permease [Ignavibacteriaceae bacterium]